MTQGNVQPIQAAENPIDPGLRIGQVHLRTADIDLDDLLSEPAR